MAQPGWFYISKKYFLAVIFVVSFISFLGFNFMTNTSQTDSDDEALKKIAVPRSVRRIVQTNSVHLKNPPGKSNKFALQELATQGLSNVEMKTKSLKSQQFLDFNVHIFYYPWYKNVKTDGKYAHWNHELIPHWSDKTHTRRRHHEPPGDIGANFYPELGPYSSADPQLIKTHMKQISQSGVGVLCISWYPPEYEQTKETPVDSLIPLYLDAADQYGLKIALHIEPYLNRSGESLREVLKYAITKFGSHPAFYRTEHKGKQLPLVYVYDSYQIKSQEWADALTSSGKFTIRGSEFDAVVIGLLVEHDHLKHIRDSGFDGFYTYFASNGFSYGSTWFNWPTLAQEANNNSLIFIPSIGPGYIDTRVRTWNGKNTKLRLHGRYYKSAFKAALAVKPPFLSVTSFNEWHEGTQVEAAVPKIDKGFKYEDYKPEKPDYYMNLTKQFVHTYHENRTAVHVIQHNHDNAF